MRPRGTANITLRVTWFSVRLLLKCSGGGTAPLDANVPVSQIDNSKAQRFEGVASQSVTSGTVGTSGWDKIRSWVKATCLACIIAGCFVVGVDAETARHRSVRTAFRSSACPSASPIGPRLHETTRPHAPLLPLGFCLRRCVAAFAILGPVERKSVSHKPVSDIRPTDGADRTPDACIGRCNDGARVGHL